MTLCRFIPVMIFSLFFTPLPVLHAQDQAIKPGEGGKASQPRAIPLEMAEDGGQFTFLAFSPDGNILVYSLTHLRGDEPSSLVFYDLRERKKVKTLKGPDPLKNPMTAVFLPDGKRLVVGYHGDPLRYFLDWRAGKFSEFEANPPGSSAPKDFALTPQGDFLVSRGSPELNSWGPVDFQVWDVHSGKQVRRFGGERGHGIGKYCLSADGRFLVALHVKAIKWAKLDPTHTDRFWIQAWDLASGNQVGMIGKPKEIAYSPDRETYSPGAKMFKELVGAAPWCRVRISPGGKIMVVPVWPRETVLEAEMIKGFVLSLRELARGNELVKFDEFAGAGGSVVFGFSPDQNTFAASGFLMAAKAGSALYVWDVAACRKKAISIKSKLTADEMDQLWGNFEKKDALHAYRALRQLAAVPKQSLPFLKKKVKPVPDRGKAMGGLLLQLADADAEVRNKARERLVEMGDEALPALKQAIQDSSSPETKKTIEGIGARIREDNQPDARTRQVLWTIELLEFLATGEALDFLSELAQGAPHAWLTQEAQASIRRIKSKN